MSLPERTGYVSEVFRSVQGEGPLVGSLQVFVRFCGCSLSCVYCDTAASLEKTPSCELSDPEGISHIDNPVDARQLARFVRGLEKRSPGMHSISITGGEPLEQREFFVSLIEAYRAEGGSLRVYLETNGTDPEAAARVASFVDIVSMDIKLPSLCGGACLFDLHGEVLSVFKEKDLFCKVVVAEGFDKREFGKAVEIVFAAGREIPFIIQPATPNDNCRAVTGEQLLECLLIAGKSLDDVRVIPQCHHLLGLP